MEKFHFPIWSMGIHWDGSMGPFSHNSRPFFVCRGDDFPLIAVSEAFEKMTGYKRSDGWESSKTPRNDSPLLKIFAKAWTSAISSDICTHKNSIIFYISLNPEATRCPDVFFENCVTRFFWSHRCGSSLGLAAAAVSQRQEWNYWGQLPLPESGLSQPQRSWWSGKNVGKNRKNASSCCLRLREWDVELRRPFSVPSGKRLHSYGK
jgi:hypothetical protein